jgi:hypothetical protein
MMEEVKAMSDSERLLELRELFLSSTVSPITQIVTIAVSVALAGLVLWLVRRRRLGEEYTPIWLIVAFVLVAISIRLDLLYALARAIGAWTASSTIFFVGEVFLVAICLNYAVRLSRTSVQIKNLAQEIALLKARVEELGG